MVAQSPAKPRRAPGTKRAAGAASESAASAVQAACGVTRTVESKALLKSLIKELKRHPEHLKDISDFIHTGAFKQHAGAFKQHPGALKQHRCWLCSDNY